MREYWAYASFLMMKINADLEVLNKMGLPALNAADPGLRLESVYYSGDVGEPCRIEYKTVQIKEEGDAGHENHSHVPY